MSEQFSDSERVWSIRELTREVRGCLEVNFGSIWVRGEVSNLFEQASGHRYFILKDSDSQLKAVLFRGDANVVFIFISDNFAVCIPRTTQCSSIFAWISANVTLILR